jgi:hypothetical protein
LRTARKVLGRRTSNAPRRKRTELTERAAEKDNAKPEELARPAARKRAVVIDRRQQFRT